MYFCFVDESGGFEAPDSSPSATPLMTICGLVLPASRIPAFTRDFLGLKRQHFPGRYTRGTGLSHILIEVKGSELLQMTRSDSRNKRRQALRFRRELFDLLNAHHAKIVGRVWVKELGRGMNPAASYNFAIQDIARHFSAYLTVQGSTGVMICDAREHAANVLSAHSVFTDKFRTGSDPIPAITEIPVFGHSENHAGLQACDLLASSVVFPIAASAYCLAAAPGLFPNPHESPRYLAVRAEFADSLRELQYRYRDENGHWRGGLVVSDKRTRKPGSLMFDTTDCKIKP
ncbi:MAG TPA: DUF3800 domain-containing protein [Jatrophihabitans sp.]|nr:DUF3800 domain-containing protein [Jatrophihabitans sp.]